MDGDNKLTINQTSNKISGIEKDVKPMQLSISRRQKIDIIEWLVVITGKVIHRCMND